MHVVDAAEDPEVAVVVALGAVAGEVDARPTSTSTASRSAPVAPDRAQHRRPRLGDGELAAADFDLACRASSRISASMPGNGSVAEPGFVGTMPGSGVIMIAPVSVCHQVSTIGQRSPPMFLWYHIHASGLIGSPTDAEQAQRRQVVRLRAAVRPTS